MKNDRFGLLMIVASLVVITIVSGLLYKRQIDIVEGQIRVNGVALVRSLAEIQSNPDYALHAAEAAKAGLMRGVVNLQDNKHFAYLVLVDQAGGTIFETTSAGSIAPPAAMPAQPYSWYGEHDLVSPGDGRHLREFFAPVMKAGQLAGFVRAGYYSDRRSMLVDQLSSYGVLALPIFLLTVLAYFLIRREIKPLARLGERMEQASVSYGTRIEPPPVGSGLDEFVRRFDIFMQMVQSRMQQMDTDSVSAQTSTKLLSYKNEKAESILNALPEAVLVIDDEGIPTFVNQKVETILTIGREEILGQPAQAWCKNKEVLGLLMRLKKQGVASRMTSMEFTPDDGSERRISVSTFPLFSPRDRSVLLGMMIVFRDISEEYLARQAGAEFVAHVSHELKTPLNTLMAYSELLQDRANLPEAEQVDAVNVIHDEVQRMTGLINNLLNISRLEAGILKLDRSRVKLHDLLQDAFDSIGNSAAGKGIALDLAVPPDLGSVRLDKGMFRIALDNLLSNAVKYSNPGGKVLVSASALDDGQVEIRVKDTGIGIAPEDCENIFAKHYRVANDETASRSGHGLGLYLAKQIVELHHGSIAVRSQPGKGSEFVIAFKAQPVRLEESEDK